MGLLSATQISHFSTDWFCTLSERRRGEGGESAKSKRAQARGGRQDARSKYVTRKRLVGRPEYSMQFHSFPLRTVRPAACRARLILSIKSALILR